jgi:hypothetical protein
MGYPAIAQLALHRYYADSVSRVDSADAVPLFATSEQPLPHRLAAHLRGFETAVCFWRHDPPALGRNLTRAGVPRVFNVDPFPPEGRRIHVAAHMLQALEPLVGCGHDPAPHLFLTEEDRSFASGFLARKGLAGRGAPVLAVHPGSGGRPKMWPASRFSEIIERASRELQARWLLICGPADACREARAGLSHAMPVVVEGASLVQLAAILSASGGYVGNDSGVTHIAAAVGAPTVAVFGPTDPAVWGPVGRHVRNVSATPWPSPDEVWKHLEAILRS